MHLLMLNGSFQFLLNLKFLKKSYTWDTALRGSWLRGEENGKFRMKIIIKHSTQTSVLDTKLSCLLMLFICSWIYMPLFPGLKLTMFTSVCLRKKQVWKPNICTNFITKEPPINVNCVNVKKPADILVWHGVTGKCLFEVFQATLDFL